MIKNRKRWIIIITILLVILIVTLLIYVIYNNINIDLKPMKMRMNIMNFL